MKFIAIILLEIALAATVWAEAEVHDLWAGESSPPKIAELAPLDGVRFHVIKKREPKADGYHWLHGVALQWHGGRLYASFGLNKGAENTAGEVAAYCVSGDGGKTWSEVRLIEPEEPGTRSAVSHGVFLSHAGELWAFLGAFENKRQKVHTRAYRFDAKADKWDAKGTVIDGGFWPMQQPIRMADGNWIMAGFIVGDGNPAAVAISEGDDMLSWKLVKIPRGDGTKMWGESSVIVSGKRVINIARFGAKAMALVAVSEDFGRTWTASQPGNLPMVTSKPYSGILSTGQRYLVATTTADSGARRFPLTIAVGPPGENRFTKVYRIRDAIDAASPGESHANAALAYPYAVEHEGDLYIGYSNSGGRGGNRNSAELAVIPIGNLVVE